MSRVKVWLGIVDFVIKEGCSGGPSRESGALIVNLEATYDNHNDFNTTTIMTSFFVS